MSTATAAKPLPTTEQLKAYADQLPEIYRQLLTATWVIEPLRRYGDPLNVGSLISALTSERKDSFQQEEVEIALDKLRSQNFIQFDGRYFSLVRPTPLGEELIAAVTGNRARRVVVPDLPNPTW